YVRADGFRQVLTWNHHPDSGHPVTQTERTGDADRCHIVVTDMIGTPVLLADPAGRLVWQSRASLWGVQAAAAGTPLRFPGQQFDPESGLHYNVYRYYDPATARYVSPDPLGLEPAPNPVSYVANPLRETDPVGLASPSCQSTSSSQKRKTPGSDNDPNAADG